MNLSKVSVVFLGSVLLFIWLLTMWLRAGNDRLEAQAKELEAQLNQVEQRYVNELSLLTDAEAEAAERVRKATPLKVRLALPDVAKVTAYTCDPTMTPEQKAMNCPNGITASRTIPLPYKTAACDRKHLGKTFRIHGLGEVKCEDTGGLVNDRIRGALAIDWLLPTHADAMEFGTRYLAYEEVK